MRLIDGRAVRRRGWVCAVAVALCLGPAFSVVQAQVPPPAAGSATIASAGETVLLREQPGFDAAVLATLGDGTAIEVSGESVVASDGSAWLPVNAGGQSGYVPAGYIAAAPATVAAPAVAPDPVTAPDPLTAPEPVIAADPATVAPAVSSSQTMTDANLRSGPSADAEILQVLPPEAVVSVDGAAENGFVPVSGANGSGWVAAELLTGTDAALPPPLVADPNGVVTSPPTEALAPAAAPETATSPETTEPAPEQARGDSTGIVWPMAGGEWEVVQGYNNGTHTNRGGFAQYKYSLDWARVDGKTAGQPVFAPVSGTVQWTDRGSGGMLVDAGNGYGVAVFHVTIDRGLGRGDSVERGQQIGTISGPGGDGFMSMAHIDMTVWRLNGRGHEATPFTGPNAIAGQEFPDNGGSNQHMGVTVTP